MAKPRWRKFVGLDWGMQVDPERHGTDLGRYVFVFFVDILSGIYLPSCFSDSLQDSLISTIACRGLPDL